MQPQSQKGPNARLRCRSRGRWAVLATALLLALPIGAWAAQVTEVRVGRHPGFTRVVFELDRPSGYRVERTAGASGPELRVTLDAAAPSQAIPFRTKGIEKVVVDAGNRSSVAHITLREEGIPVKEMILTNPPRIVLDVMRANEVVAKKPAPPPAPQKDAEAEAERLAAEKAAREKAEAERLAAEKAAREKAKAEKLAAEKAAREKAEAERLAAEKAAREKAEAERLAAEKAAREKAEAERLAAEKAAREKAEAERLAAEKAAAEKAEAERLAAEKAAAEKAKAEKLAAEKAAREKAEAERLAAEKAAREKAEAERLAAEKAAAEKAKAEKLVAQKAQAEEPAADEAAADAEGDAPDTMIKVAQRRSQQVAEREPAQEAAPKKAPKKAETKAAEKEKPSTPALAQESPLFDLLGNQALWIAGAGVLLVLVGFLLMRRRRRPLPNDLDVMAIAEGDEGPANLTESLERQSDVVNESGSGSTLDGLFDDDSDSQPAADARPTPPAPRNQPSAAQGAADDSLFITDDDDADPNAATTMGDPNMNQGISDLPADPDRMGAAPSPSGSAAPDSDVLRVVHELERRMAQLEGKLQEANEARERLERQVAAQSEELRVQRAAIARTQRALRTMSRGDEDKATEPALRDGDTQTKTRVSVD